MVRALIFGAGAIGRGFIPLCLARDAEITFVDISQELIKCINKNKEYSIYLSHNGALERHLITPRRAIHLSASSEINYSSFDIVFIAVGPRNIEKLPSDLSAARAPIFCLENDPDTVERLKTILSRDSIFFGVPDVITSSSASPDNLRVDNLSIHTENGVLYLSRPDNLPPKLLNEVSAVWIDDQRLQLEWDAKLYIHNTPHCIAAYLGKLAGCTYLHEAMQIQSIEETIKGVIDELLRALRVSNKYDYEFLTSYADKEIHRFKDINLYDPIDRVARQPLRKLRYGKHGRLLGALHMCLTNDVLPHNLLVGVAAALSYSNQKDDDTKTLALIQSYGVENFIWHFLSIKPNSLMSELISRAYEKFKINRG
jgi:ketopantoate reductase